MPNYVLLMSYTPEGIIAATKGARPAAAGEPVATTATTATSLTRISERLEEGLSLFGAGLVAFYWLLGDHDMMAVIEADSDVGVTGVALWLAAQAGVTTQTLRAYDADAIGAVGPEGMSVAGALYRCYADAPSDHVSNGD